MVTNGFDPFECRGIPRVPTLKLTRLGFGGAPLGGFPKDVPRGMALRTILAALRGGLNWFDFAVLYGCGKSLRLAGEAFDKIDASQLIVTTKVGRRPVPATRQRKRFDIYHAPDPFDLVYDYTAEGVRTAVEFSLERLKRSAIDMVFVHDPDAEGAPRFRQVLDETIPALVKLKQEGVVRAIGVGMNGWEMPLLFLKYGAPLDVILCAGCYNIIEQGALELFGPCAEANVALLNGGVFGSGLLASRPGAKPASFRYAKASAEVMRKARAFWELCRRHKVPRHATALQFAAPNPVTAIPLGAVTPAQVKANISAAREKIPGEFWDELRVTCGISKLAPMPKAS